MSRLFFALWPDEAIRDRLNKIAQQFKDTKVRLVKKSNLHITLAFLGEVSALDRQALIENASTIKSRPFELVLTRIGWWRQADILWIGTNLVPDELSSLVKSIKKHCKARGSVIDKRSYKPHVTIARKVKQVTVPKATFALSWKVKSFVLVSSKPTDTGVEYNVVNEWPL